MTREKVNETLLVISTGLLVLFFIFKLNGFVIAAAVIGVLGLASKWAGDKIAWLWMKLSEVLGYVNGRILLSLIFFLFLVPIAFLSRLSRGNTLQLKKKPEGSYFSDRNHSYVSKDLEKSF